MPPPKFRKKNEKKCPKSGFFRCPRHPKIDFSGACGGHFSIFLAPAAGIWRFFGACGEHFSHFLAPAAGMRQFWPPWVAGRGRGGRDTGSQRPLRRRYLPFSGAFGIQKTIALFFAASGSKKSVFVETPAPLKYLWDF